MVRRWPNRHLVGILLRQAERYDVIYAELLILCWQCRTVDAGTVPHPSRVPLLVPILAAIVAPVTTEQRVIRATIVLTHAQQAAILTPPRDSGRPEHEATTYTGLRLHLAPA